MFDKRYITFLMEFNLGCVEVYREYRERKLKKKQNAFPEGMQIPESIKIVFAAPLESTTERKIIDVETTTERRRKIIAGGTDALADEFPFMAVLVWQSQPDSSPDFSCGGTLVSEKFVLTAAHCTSLDGSVLIRNLLYKI